MSISIIISHGKYKFQKINIMKTNKLYLSRYLLFVGVIFMFWSCEENTDIPERTWELVWQDEFNTIPADSLPDSNKWTYDLGGGGWGNNEWQVYTNSKENVRLDVDDTISSLKIIARQEGVGYTSARIKTQGIFEQAYGRFEARIKMPYGPGMWPAFWLLGADIDENPWPACGEIDIMEYRGQEPNRIHGTIHGPELFSSNAITQTYGLENARFDTDYHLFAVEWTEEVIDFFVDETLYQRITKTDVESAGGTWVYDDPFFIILNVAVGGNFVGESVAGTVFPQTLYVDYVRVYQEVK
jgi:beta-glucanase (GH16 family)